MRRVVRRFERRSLVYDLTIGGHTIGTTSEHPFFVRGKGWTPAKELQPGDAVRLLTPGWQRVDSNVDTGRSETVYNLEIEGDHTYFVGDLTWGWQVWAHNRECTVYQELSRGVYKYIGITYNFAKRANNHLNEAGGRIIEIIPGLGILTRKEARAIEHLLINKIGRVKTGTGTLMNKNSGIKPRNLKHFTNELATWRKKLTRLGLL